MQIDNHNVVVYSNLDDQTKQSTLSFLVNQDDVPYIQVSAGNAGSPIRITNLGAPMVGADATNKDYVDSVVRGLVVKNPVRLLAVADVSLTNLVPGYLLDGKALRLDDRVLLAGQTNAVENGLYIITATGAVRTTDLPAGSLATGVYVFVDEGDTYMDRSYVCTTDRVDASNNPSAVVGTHPTQWIQFGARPTALAGNGLVLGNANELDVNVDGSTLEVVADVVKIKNPDIKLKVQRGLLRSSTNGTTATSPTVDNADPAILGATVPLGTNLTVAPDFTVLPDLQNANTFSAKNTYSDATLASWTEDGNGVVTLDGAVVVSGGVAIRQNLIAHRERLTSTTDATSTSTGALVVDGGVGIAKALHVGGDAYTAAVHAVSADAATWSATGTLSGAVTVDGHAVVRSELHTATVAVHGDADSTTVSTGAVTVSGGLGVAKNVTCPTAHLVGTVGSTSPTTGTLTVAGGAGVAENLHIGGDCHVTNAVTASTGHILSTTTSTGTTSGALVVDGGVGIAGTVNIGGDERITGQVYADNVTDAAWQSAGALAGAVQVEGGVAVRKSVRCSEVHANATTASSSTTTGSLVVAGGAGIAQNVYVGSDINVGNVARCNGTADATWHSTNPLTGALLVEGGVSIRKDIHSTNSISHGTTNATWDSVAALAGAITTEGGLSVRKDVHCLNANVHSSTPATSQTTGALVVAGGVGVGGSIYCTSTYNMSDERLKRNREIIPDALDHVCKMNGYTFEWNERMPGLENTKAVGLIAQEVKEQAPLCVMHNPETDLYAVEYSKLIPYMVESIKTLKRKCDELTEQLTQGTTARSDETNQSSEEAKAPKKKRSKKQ